MNPATDDTAADNTQQVQASAVPEPVADAVAESVRWPLQSPLGATERLMYSAEQRQLLGWIASGNAAQRQRAIDTLQHKLSGEPADLQAVITAEGSRPGAQRAALLQARDEAFERALLWTLTGDEAQAQRARDILLRFAQMMPQWPLYATGANGRTHSQADAAYRATWAANGLWGRWYPLDLEYSVPLLRAYDLLRPALDAGEQQTLHDLFVYQKELIDGFSGLTDLYHNADGYHLLPLVRFGMVLERPEYVHEAVRHLRKQLQYSYPVDGFFRDVTPDYHSQISIRLRSGLPDILNGYTDPTGYRDAVSGERFDNLDLSDLDVYFTQMDSALNLLALPDGYFMNINDSWPKRMKVPSGVDPLQPGLLGVTGIAKLAAGDMVAFLKFGGIRGHDHRDALNLVWFAGGREVFSDTGYRARTVQFEREWSESTASHMTVAVDEQLHFTDIESTALPVKRSRFAAMPPEVAGTYPLEAALPGAARLNNQGRLLVWDAGSAQVQAAEAEQPAAYPGKLDMFRRTLVMVPHAEGGGYLVDIFRIRGGRVHDYFVRGGLDEAFTLDGNVPLEPAQGKLYRYIELEGAARLEDPVSLSATYADGQKVVSRLAALPSAGDSMLSLLIGRAPAIRREGEAPFAVIRHEALPQSGVLESCFVWVHETSPGSAGIQAVDVVRDGMDVRVRVTREGAEDIIFSGVSSQSRFDWEGWQFQGALAFARTDADGVSGRVFQGGDLVRGQTRISGRAPLTGEVVRTTQRDQGDAANTVLIRSDAQPDGDYRLLHLDFDPQIRFSIPVKQVQRTDEGILVELAYPPGFRVEDGASTMTRFPGWRVQGSCRAVLE